jgi:hypothetical protein
LPAAKGAGRKPSAGMDTKLSNARQWKIQVAVYCPILVTQIDARGGPHIETVAFTR